MSKRTTAEKTTPTKTARNTLVGTQHQALRAITRKRELATLAVKLAKDHGTQEHKALKRTELERWKLDELREHVAEIAVRAHGRKRVHLSELGGWPICWPEERREKVKPVELLTTPIAADAEAMTCSRCKKGGQLPSKEETAAFKRAELEATQKKERKGKRAKGAKGKTAGMKRIGSVRVKRKLQLEENLRVRLKIKDLEMKGSLRPDGTLTVKGRDYPNPHAAANELAGELVSYRIDGFQAWRFQDEDGKWRMLRDYV